MTPEDANGALLRERVRTRDARAQPTPIIAFAKDWHEDPTSNHHVLRELAKTRRVLWLNSIATRTPKLSSGRDLGKIAPQARASSRAGPSTSRTTCG